jgi:hypothetical protein
LYRTALTSPPKSQHHMRSDQLKLTKNKWHMLIIALLIIAVPIIAVRTTKWIRKFYGYVSYCFFICILFMRGSDVYAVASGSTQHVCQIKKIPSEHLLKCPTCRR